jgi:hypothetical protein
MLRARLLLPAATIAAAFAVAGPAAADTYCVHQAGGCPAGTTDAGSDLVQALSDAASTPAADTVTIGPGTFTAPVGGFKVMGTSPLTVVGSGPSTVLDGATSPIVGLVGPAPTLSGVAVQVAPQASALGVSAYPGASVHDVLVTGTGPSPTGINVAGTATVDDAQIVLTSNTAIGIWASDMGGGAPTISDSTIVAGSDVYAIGHGTNVPFTIHRILAVGRGLDIAANGAYVNIDDSVIHHTSGSSSALSAGCPGIGGSATINADHVTIAGDGNGTAVESACTTAGDTSTLSVTNSTFRDFAKLSYRYAANGATADIAATWSDLPSGNNGDTGPGAVTLGAGNVAVADPGFVGIGDERLVAGSPLVDAGNPLPAAFALDRDGLARVSGGRQDIGAYELQVPGATTPSAASGTPGLPADAASDATAGDAVPTTTPGVPLSPPAQPTRAQLRAALTAAIRTGTHGTHTLRWLTAGRVTFTWRVHGHVVARGTAARTAPGRQRVVVRGAHRLPRHGTITVRATFTPVLGRAVTVDRRLAR